MPAEEIRPYGSKSEDLMTQLKMLLTFKEREMSELRDVVHDDFLKLVRGTQGLSLIGNRYPISPENADAYERIEIAMRHHIRSLKELDENVFEKDELLAVAEDFLKSVRDDLVLRSQTSEAVPLVVAETVSKMFPGGMREEYQPPEVPAHEEE